MPAPSPSNFAVLSGDVSGPYRRSSPLPIPLRRHFLPISLPITSTRPSPATILAFIVAHHLHLFQLPSSATFSASIVARHLHPSLSGDIFGLYRCPSPPCISVQRRSWPLSLPDTSADSSSATFSAHIVAHHPHLVLLLSPAPFSASIVARHLRPSLSGDIPGLYRCPSPPSSPAALSGYVSSHIVAHHLHLSLLLSPATFPAHIVARHLHLVQLLSPAPFSALIVVRQLRLFLLPFPATFPALSSPDTSI